MLLFMKFSLLVNGSKNSIISLLNLVGFDSTNSFRFLNIFFKSIDSSHSTKLVDLFAEISFP